MSFEVTQEALEALGWPELVALWADECRTPHARVRLQPTASDDLESSADSGAPESAGREAGAATGLEGDLFARSHAAMQTRLDETSEARRLLDEEQRPPLGLPLDATPLLGRAMRGRALESRDLLAVASCAEAVRDTRRFLDERADTAPRLRDLAEPLAPCPDLLSEIQRCIEPSGDISDRASPALAKARRDRARLAGDLQKKLQRYAQHADVSPHLSDDFVTVRNDRYVLPVRTDSRGSVPGIVHDASRSGTTLFIEPEAVVDLNNRLKQADLTILRECERVLVELSALVGEHADTLGRSLAALGRIDLAFARGHLSQRMQGLAPEVGREGVLDLPGLRHPLLPQDACVANDLRVGDGFTVLVISGPNAGGKTVALKAMGLAALMVRAGLHVPCDAGARVDCIDRVLADIGDGQSIAMSLSTFSAHMTRLAATVREAGAHSLVVLDEIGVGTDPAEGAALAQALLETLAANGARVVTTTHFNLLKEMATARPDFENACVDFDPETLEPTYRVRIGAAGPSSAAVVAARMGMPRAVLDRAEALLDREDRRLEEALAELAADRAALDHERTEARARRDEAESSGAEYDAQLRALREERDRVYGTMRDELDASFREAHAEVASLIRALQRGGTARKAAEVRERLLEIEKQTERDAAERGIAAEPEPKQPDPGARPIDWTRMQVGDRVRVPGGRDGVLETLPDRGGRVRVQAGGTRLTVDAARLSLAPGGGQRGQKDERVRFVRSEPEPDDHASAGGSTRCDLRGQRVAVALDALDTALDRAAADGFDQVEIVHGHGTGALRAAVREHLGASPIVTDLRSGDPEAGGEGVTIAVIGRRG